MTVAPPMTAPQGARLSHEDLAELIGAFNEATAKLHTSHDALVREVARLKDELRDANEALERSRRLAALGEMAAGIAHEVRNPLASIRLHARILEEDLADRPGEQGVSRKIIKAVAGLDAVVTDVLAFSREMRLDRGEVDASEAITRALEAALAPGEAPGLLVQRVDETRPALTLNADADHLHSALVNVLRNAVQAMAGAGTGGRAELTIDAERRLVRRTAASRPEPMAVLSVRDTGPGISDEVLERMFNPFFTTRAAGTGLGLPIVHRIVDAHGGRVVVFNNSDRQPGARGATVELRLPVREAPAPTEIVVRGGAGMAAEGSR